jgi:hypothetical protein
MGTPVAVARGAVAPERPVRVAVSLRELQSAILETRGASLPKEIAELGGMTRPLGYVIDKETNDLILFGEKDPSEPAVFLEDFIVAVRNAWLKYARREGRTVYYSDPGCSIDPPPKVIQDLGRLGEAINSAGSAKETDEFIRDWERICKSPQTVKVVGVPFDSRFGRVMVMADYELKRLVDGSDSLKSRAFWSLTDTTLGRFRSSMLRGANEQLSLSFMNRFWFFPGNVVYGKNSEVTVIEQCPITLLTEEQYEAKGGKLVGRGTAEPLAKAFADNFGKLYEAVARERPIYRELESLFRLVAIAKMMEYAQAPDAAGIGLGSLLDKHEIASVRVDRTLPGRSNVKKFSHREYKDNGYVERHVWLPSCGGVSMEIKPGRAEIRRDEAELSSLAKSIKHKRPNGKSVSWVF